MALAVIRLSYAARSSQANLTTPLPNAILDNFTNSVDLLVNEELLNGIKVLDAPCSESYLELDFIRRFNERLDAFLE